MSEPVGEAKQLYMYKNKITLFKLQLLCGKVLVFIVRVLKRSVRPQQAEGVDGWA